ncbi:alkaline phosphatase family protein [Leucobacter sp. CSA2]|uniref:Alkaline phosphatase family protein n=1 Tax=Leucobacter edaphi TaxID=2796472 RepID=A0A934QBC1_9MICO|nr:nucleotide pyrophosphatase/phosphodiesterase family protein [Leucobacter edaphi]MBK0421268.1 alkaline phosphatase family protein [Leucobacter edaphi]
MLPTTSDNGARLAAILPTGLAALARGAGLSAVESLSDVIGAERAAAADAMDADRLRPTRSFVIIVVDGLGHANLQGRIGHAPTLAALARRRIETVSPSTTGAALTTITTGRLPGEHGLIGYRIRHPRLGLVTTLSEWEGIDDIRAWQRAEPLFRGARLVGARAVVTARPAHEESGLTTAILTGAEYLPAQRIEDRFAAMSAAVRSGDPLLGYLYIDELDRAAHHDGWESREWCSRLERLDAALDDFLRTLPSDVGVVLTADHGIVDVDPSLHVLLDEAPGLLDGVAEVGGEPRLRSFYLEDPSEAAEFAARLEAAEGKRAWVATREEAVASGAFGSVEAAVAQRLGDVVLAARKRVAYYLSTDAPQALAMIGQHGSFTDEERGVPLAVAGALAGSGFASAVAALAAVGAD